jgi:hypothetical protein
MPFSRTSAESFHLLDHESEADHHRRLSEDCRLQRRNAFTVVTGCAS